MGTRASFWIGDPRDLENRKWLGCIAWDGYPDGVTKALAEAKDENQFIDILKGICSDRDDFASPENGWPYPWDDDIFLTDFTYAFFGGKPQVACYHRGFVPFSEIVGKEDSEEDLFGENDNLSESVPAPKAYDNSQPDSILIFKMA